MVEASGIDFSDVVAAISEDYSTYENKVNRISLSPFNDS